MQPRQPLGEYWRIASKALAVPHVARLCLQRRRGFK
jgi:hypothetical protein